MSAFELSRIYGQGWNVAKQLIADGAVANAAQLAKLNPYRAEDERARWAKGFEEAISSRTPARSVAFGRRPTRQR